MSLPAEISEFTDDQGLTFLELLAHNLTIGVRMAASRRQPYGPLTEEEARLAMYWINEVLHNVVQLTRQLRLERERWSREQVWNWFELWRGHTHGAKEIIWAIEQSLDELAGKS